MGIAETNDAARHMADDWAHIDPADASPDALAELLALAFEIRQAVEKEWENRDDR